MIIDNRKISPAKARWNDKTQRLHLILIEGKKRQVRKMCEAVGLEVMALKRIRIGNITLKGLRSSQWRYITQQEMDQL